MFAEGSFVSVVGVSTMQKVKIERISDSGVTVSGPECGQFLTISGKSPAVAYIEPVKEAPKVIVEKVPAASIDEKQPHAHAPETEVPKLGSMKDKMNDPKIPDGQFSVNQVADLNGVPYPYAFKWVKEKCKAVGTVPREPGKRGRATTLYVVGK